MSMSDPIADLLTRIRNANQRMHAETRVPHSKIKQHILDVLKEEGFITGYEVMPSGAFRELVVQLKYYEGKRVIRNIERVSKPGLRTYQRSQDLKKVLGGQGISILSTSHGVMSDEECRLRKIGGEVLCQVW